MKKEMTFMIAGLFAFVFFLGLASATLSVSSFSDLTQNDGSFTINVSSTLNETVVLSIADIVSNGETITFTLSDYNIVLDESNLRKQEVTVTYDIPVAFEFEIGEIYSTNLVLDGSNSTTLTKEVKFKESTFCGDVENQGKLKISDVNINVINGFGDDDSYWYLLDEVEIEIEVENTGSWDIKNVEIEWELRTTDGTKILDDTLSDFDLNEDDTETVTFTFILDEDLDKFEGNDAILYFKATGEIDDSKSAYDGDNTCVSRTEEVEVVTKDDFVIATDFEVNGEKVSGGILKEPVLCGSTLEITSTIYNIGEDKQKDVYVEIYNKVLGIYEKVELGDIKAFDSQEISYVYKVPKELDEKTYNIQFEVFDDGNDIFENDEGDEARTNVYFKIEGNCQVELTPTISATLVSEKVVEGENVEIKVTVLNDDSDAMFSVAPQGYDSFADLLEVSPQIDTIKVGEAKDFLIKFKLKDGVSGDQQFTVVTSSGGKVIATQNVLLPVEAKSFELDLTKYFRGLDWPTVGIILLNLILVIAIIIVARRVLKRK